MLPQHDYLIEKELDYQLGELRREIASQRLQRAAGLRTGPWLSCQVCRVLFNFGHMLVSTGRRLERRYGPTGAYPVPTVSADGR
jgi:hypothetical protein